MLHDEIRKLYVSAIHDNIIKPHWTDHLQNEDGNIRDIITKSLSDLEDRIRECCTTRDNLYKHLSSFESFKCQIRDIEAYITTMGKKRLKSTSNMLAGESDVDCPLQAVKEYRTQLRDNLQLQGTLLLDRLIQDNCLNDDDAKSILKEPTNQRRNDLFLHKIATRFSGDMIINNFLPALEIEHEHLANGLSEVLSGIRSIHGTSKLCSHCKLKGKVEPKCVADMLYKKGHISDNELRDYSTCTVWTEEKWSKILDKIQDVGILVEALKTNYPNVYEELVPCDDLENLKVCTCSAGKPDTVSIRSDVDNTVFDSTDTLIESYHMPAYPMDSQTRGICVIIHNTEYNTEYNSKNDIAKLDNLFSGYGFSVWRITNLTTLNIQRELKQISEYNHIDYDAFICVVALGGSDKDHVCDVRGEALHISYIIRPFKAKACPSLASKPKVFLFPYASGSKRTPGFVIKEPVPQSPLETTKTIVPDDADILYARGTLPGYTTSSCKRTGSWFINNFLEVMGRHGDTNDFVSCLAMVNNGVGRVEYTKNDVTYTQTSHVTSTLRKGLYFKRPRMSRTRSMSEEGEDNQDVP